MIDSGKTLTLKPKTLIQSISDKEISYYSFAGFYLLTTFAVLILRGLNN